MIQLQILVIGLTTGWVSQVAPPDTVTDAAAAAAAVPTRYDGDRVVRAELRTQRDLMTLLALSEDPWSEGVGLGVCDFRVPAGAMAALDASGIQYRVLIPDVQALIDAEAARISAHEAERAAGVRGIGWFDEFKALADIEAYLTTLRDLQPDRMATFSIGNTIQNRPTRAASLVGRGARTRPALFLNGCQHAREWISPMTVMFITDALAHGYGTDPRISRILDRVEFLVVPVSNPDGYVYTWTNQRLWRKNRRANAGGSFGVDVNRNWGFQWGGVGASTIPSNDLYRGTAPFSEPEATNLRDFILAHPNIAAHVDVHSYSQYILWPWCYTNVPSPYAAEFAALSAELATEIASVHGTVYQPGQWYSRLYPSSGTMIDWAYGDRNIRSWTWELRDTGAFGFVLPPNQIIPTGEEILAAVLHLAETLYIPGDWDGSGAVEVPDIFAFLADWIALDGAGDFDGSGVSDVPDIFGFLAAWFEGE